MCVCEVRALRTKHVSVIQLCNLTVYEEQQQRSKIAMITSSM